MRFFQQFWILFAFLLIQAQSNEVEDDEEGSAEITKDGNVLVLTDDNFDDAIEKHKVIMVEFYAPWCGHCKSLAPIYEEAATKMADYDPPVAFAKVDATVEKALGTRFSISGYPTLKIFHDGQPYEFEGDRSLVGLIGGMKEHLDPSWEPPKASVVALTDETFDQWIAGKELALVEFYAPWCGHCKKLEPEYEKAAKTLLQSDPPIPLAKVDATVATAVAQKYGVSGYPTLKVFRNGAHSEYKGPREGRGIADYMKRQQGLPSIEARNAKHLKELMKIDDVTVIGFFDSNTHPLYLSYIEAGNQVRDDYTLAHSFDDAVRESMGASKNSIGVFMPERFQSQFEKKAYFFQSKEPTADTILGFIRDHHRPLVGEMTSGNRVRLYDEKRPLCVAFYDVDFGFEHRKQTQYWRKKVLSVANKYKGKVTFAIADESGMEADLKSFGLDNTGAEVNVGCLDETEQRFRLESDDEIDDEVLEEFIGQFLKKKLKPFLRSQPVPAKQPGPVKIVVGKTFRDIVLDDSKDVLIEFYAPWCGHCKHLEPTYNSLAKHFAGESSIVIAKMDATANDAPPAYKAEGFPTIYFAPAGKKDAPVKFEGGQRELADFIKFVKANAALPLKSKDEL